MSHVESLLNLKIHKLVDEAQYGQAVADGAIDPNALYLTPSQQANWSQTDSTKDDYIKNKPDLDAEYAPNSSITIATFTITEATNRSVTLNDFSSGDVKINWGDGTVETLGSFPATHEYPATGTYVCKIYGLTCIGNSAFAGCANLTGVIIGNGVASIRNSAFYECALKSVVIPDSVTSIGEKAFYGCASLKSVEIPDSVTSIGLDAFKNCTSLTSVYIDDIVNWCNITFGLGTTANPLSNGANLYLNNELVTELVIPESVTKIKDNAFCNCESLTSVIIPDSVTSIGGRAFWGCTSLTNVVIPDSVTKVGSSAFRDCTLLTSVAVNSDTIGDYAFLGCTSLTSVVIGESVTSIGSSAFYGCTALTSATLPTSAISSIPKTNLQTVVITSGTSISGGTFSNCTNLTSVVIGDSVNYIFQSAFQGCTSLTSVVIGDSVTSIGRGAFTGCSRLSRLTIKTTKPPSLTSSLTAILPNTIAKILVPTGSLDAYKTDWSSFASNIYEYSELPAIGSFPGESIADNCTAGNVISFSAADPNFIDCGCKPSIIAHNIYYETMARLAEEYPTSDIKIVSRGTTSISYYSGLTLESKVLVVPSSVVAFDRGLSGGGCFEYNTFLKSVVIPGSVHEISPRAFIGCSNLINVVIGAGVNRIGGVAFCDCTSLTSVVIPDSVTNISWDAFKNTAYYNDESNWEDGVLYIGKHLIEAKTDISGVYIIKDGTLCLGGDAFNYCTSLTSVVIPKSVTSISCDAFGNCDYSRTSLYYNGTEEEYNNILITDDIYTSSHPTSIEQMTVYYYSEIQPNTPGNYWRYVDGVPTPW